MRKHRLEGLFRGRLRFTVTGTALYGLINALHESGMVVRQQHCTGAQFCGEIRRKDRKRLERLVAAHHLTLTLEENRSLPAFLHRQRYRFGIPAGLLLGAGILLYAANVVLVIEIEGNTSVQDTEVLQVLSECGIHRGTFIGTIDFYRSELALHAAYPQIAWTGIRHTGNRLVVELLETELKPELADTRIPAHVVAAHTAQITAASVRCGTFQKHVGDAVQEGEVLISGIQADEYEHLEFRHALGEITGIYEEQQTFFSPAEQTVRSRTGAVTEQRWLDLFSVQVPLCRVENPYTDYNVMQQRTPLTLFGKSLPLAIERQQYLEYRTETHCQTESQQRQDLEAQRKRYEENFLKDVEILEATPHYIKKETAMLLTVSYVLQGEIGTEKELFLKAERMPYVSGTHKKEPENPPAVHSD